jgi:hypothetical protein
MKIWRRCFKYEASPEATACVGIGSVVTIAIDIVVENVTGERHHKAIYMSDELNLGDTYKVEKQKLKP